MTRFQQKAEGQVKQMVGQMTGDHRLEQEGREQLQDADRPSREASRAVPKEGKRRAQSRSPKPEQKR